MTNDVGDHEHLGQIGSQLALPDVYPSMLGAEREKILETARLGHVRRGVEMDSSCPNTQLALEDSSEGQRERLRGLIGGVVVDLGRSAIEKLIHRRHLAAFERRMDRQRLHCRLDHPLKQSRKVGLEDARQLILDLQIFAP